MLINTTLVCHDGSAHSDWQVISNPNDLPPVLQAQNIDLVGAESNGWSHVQHAADYHKSSTKLIRSQQNNVQSDIPMQSYEDQVGSDIVPSKKVQLSRGRGGRGRRGRGGGGRQKRGAHRESQLNDEFLQTRSFRPRKSTCYLELPDYDEDDNDDKEVEGTKRRAAQNHVPEDFDCSPIKKHRKKRNMYQKFEKDEANEDGDALHGKNPLLLKLAKKTDSGAEWKVETVTSTEDVPADSLFVKTSPPRSPSSTSNEERVSTYSAGDKYLTEDKQLSYPTSLSDSDVTKSPTTNIEEAKESKVGSELLKPHATPYPSGCRSKPPYSKFLMAKKRRILMRPKKGGVLFMKAMKECSAKSKMQPTTLSKLQPPREIQTVSSKETAAAAPPPVVPAVKPESPPAPPSASSSTLEDNKPTRSAIFTLDKKREKGGRIKERRRTNESLIISRGRFRCNLCDNYFQTRLAAKKHWLNFHHVPGGSTSPSRDISEANAGHEVSEMASPGQIVSTVKPTTPPLPPLPPLPLSQPLPPVPALQPITSAPYAVPISSFSYAQSSSSVLTTDESGKSDLTPTPAQEKNAPLDLPVRFLDTI